MHRIASVTNVMQTEPSSVNDAPARPDLYPPAAHILGAPKCGTTALAHYLAEHPQIAFSHPKETHHYSTDLPGLRRSTDDASYRAMFSETPATRLMIEGSVWYLYSDAAVPAILNDRPDAKFVVMLRNPVKMLPSLHSQLLHALDESEQDFRTAWNLSGQRAAGEAIPKSCRAPSTLIYTRTAAFGEMIERLFDRVPRERCKIFFQEEMAQDTAAAYHETLAFLGLDDDRRTEFPRINEAKRSRSRALQYVIARAGPARQLISKPVKKLTGKSSLGVHKALKSWNDVKTGPLDIPDDLKAEIAAHYGPDMARLGKLLDRDLSELGWPVSA